MADTDEVPRSVIRPATVRAYATEAGFSRVDVLPIEHDFWRFYRLVPGAEACANRNESRLIRSGVEQFSGRSVCLTELARK